MDFSACGAVGIVFAGKRTEGRSEEAELRFESGLRKWIAELELLFRGRVMLGCVDAELICDVL
jgi:hypothetical protein